MLNIRRVLPFLSRDRAASPRAAGRASVPLLQRPSPATFPPAAAGVRCRACPGRRRWRRPLLFPSRRRPARGGAFPGGVLRRRRFGAAAGQPGAGVGGWLRGGAAIGGGARGGAGRRLLIDGGAPWRCSSGVGRLGGGGTVAGLLQRGDSGFAGLRWAWPGLGWPGVPLRPRPVGTRDGAGGTGLPHNGGGGGSLRRGSGAPPPDFWRSSLPSSQIRPVTSPGGSGNPSGTPVLSEITRNTSGVRI